MALGLEVCRAGLRLVTNTRAYVHCKTPSRIGLREKGVRKILGVVTWSKVAAGGRTSYDNKVRIKAAAIIAGIDVEQYKTTGEPSDRLTIEIETSTDVSMPGPASAKA